MTGYKSKKKAAEDKMETRKKKKSEDEFFDLVGYTEGSVKEVKVVKGSHLTVTTYPDGKTELVWDDEALMRDVQDAIKSYEATEFVGSLALGEKPKRTKKAK